ncbi:MAG: 1-acyl-sn-glycerol-3-phosphate acyltransferase [Myxococcota bacterium]
MAPPSRNGTLRRVRAALGWSPPLGDTTVGARLFRHVEVAPEWPETARALAAQGPLVFVLPHASRVDVAALDHLTRRHDLPSLDFVNLPPSGSASSSPRAGDLRRVIEGGGSAALYLKRSPDLLRGGTRPRGGRQEGAALLRTLIAQQRASSREIALLPLLFVWTPHAEQRGGASLWDALVGTRETPTDVRRAGQFLVHRGHGRLVSGPPLPLRAFLDAQSEEDDPSVLERRLSFALLRKVERQRRVVVGPVQKPPDRTRAELLRSPKLRATIDELAGPQPEARDALLDRADAILAEMQTVSDPPVLQRTARLADAFFARAYDGVDVDEDGLARLRTLQREGSVVLLPSHKSHVDYIVLSWLLRRRGFPAPVIAAGDNLSFFPAGPILRRCGAFFIRRRFRGDKLYAALLDAYMRRLLREGHTIEFFLEGTRSRSGKLLPPQLGLLNLIVASALTMEHRRLFFLPVSIGYERMMEEGAFSRELSGGEKRKEDASALLEATGVLTEHWGRINVQFGNAFDLDALRQELGIASGAPVKPARRRALVKSLAYQVMREINRVTAVTPGSLASVVLLSHRPQGMSYGALRDRAARLLAVMQRRGARVSPALSTSAGALREEGLKELLGLYVRGGLVTAHVPGDTLVAADDGPRGRVPAAWRDDVHLTPRRDKRLRLDFAKNHIVHWFVDRALVAVGHHLGPDDEVETSVLRDRVRALSRLFKYEFTYRADADFDTIFSEVLEDMQRHGELVCAGEGGGWRPPQPADPWLGFLRATLRNFIEAYLIAARSLAPLRRGPQRREDLVVRALRTGERMFLQGEIERSEAVSRPLFDNAFLSFVDQGYLTKGDGQLALAESFATSEGIATIEARIAGYLRR